MPWTFEARTRASLLLAAADPANGVARAAFADCYEPLIRDWIRRKGLQPSDQDDVAQTVLTRIFEWLNNGRYDPSKRFRGMLYRAVCHAVVDLYRGWHRRPGARGGGGDSGVMDLLHEAPAPDDARAVVDEVVDQIERDQQVGDACERIRARVKPRTWEAFRLTAVEGLTGPEAAERLGMNETAVLMAKHRVLKMVRRELANAPGWADPDTSDAEDP
jgi:RNA polymerase sigma factor (sigma-70 family)